MPLETFLTHYTDKCLNSLSFVFTELRDLFRSLKERHLRPLKQRHLRPLKQIQNSVTTACSTSCKEQESVLVMEKTGIIKKPVTGDFKKVLWSKIKLHARLESSELLRISPGSCRGRWQTCSARGSFTYVSDHM